MTTTTIRTPAKIIPHAFPGIKPDEVEEIIANSRIKTYPPKSVICKEDAIEHTFYMILDGNFEVTKTINNSNKRYLKTLGAGDFFGEMALIHSAPRAATVTSVSDAILLELDDEGFNRVLKHSSSVAMAMVGEISNRLRQNDEMAIEDLRMRASELADAYEKLAEQELARREFLSNIAHELRTPLMIASGYLHILNKGVPTKEQLATSMETITRNVDQIVTLTNDILFLQEMDLVLPEFQPVNIVEVVNCVLNKYKDKAGAHQIRLTHTVNHIISNIRGDAKSLERAITALVDNAIKFSKNGGEVEISYSETGTHVGISVQDHGIGIDPEILPRIYDRFFHLEKHGDELYSGVGIGLSIARQVILQHKGTLDTESTPGIGSKFRMNLLKWK